MEVIPVEKIIEDDYRLVIAWVSVIAVILTWIIGLARIPEVNEVFISLFNLIDPLIDSFVDYILFIF
jgi:phage-related protein